MVLLTRSPRTGDETPEQIKRRKQEWILREAIRKARQRQGASPGDIAAILMELARECAEEQDRQDRARSEMRRTVSPYLWTPET